MINGVLQPHFDVLFLTRDGTFELYNAKDVLLATANLTDKLELVSRKLQEKGEILHFSSSHHIDLNFCINYNDLTVGDVKSSSPSSSRERQEQGET